MAGISAIGFSRKKTIFKKDFYNSALYTLVCYFSFKIEFHNTGFCFSDIKIYNNMIIYNENGIKIKLGAP